MISRYLLETLICFFEYKFFFSINRQPCSWDITLDRLREKEIELEEKPKLDHSFVSFIFQDKNFNFNSN
jgi:hypothetical protein